MAARLRRPDAVASPSVGQPNMDELLAAAVGAVPDGATRPGQQAMAAAVAKAAETGEHLLVQAGTRTRQTVADPAPRPPPGGPGAGATPPPAPPSPPGAHAPPRPAPAAPPPP